MNDVAVDCADTTKDGLNDDGPGAFLLKVAGNRAVGYNDAPDAFSYDVAIDATAGNEDRRTPPPGGAEFASILPLTASRTVILPVPVTLMLPLTVLPVGRVQNLVTVTFPSVLGMLPAAQAISLALTGPAVSIDRADTSATRATMILS